MTDLYHILDLTSALQSVKCAEVHKLFFVSEFTRKMPSFTSLTILSQDSTEILL